MRVLTTFVVFMLYFSAFTQTRINNPWAEQTMVVSDSADIIGYQALSDSLTRKMLTMELLDSNSVDSIRIWRLSHIVYSGWEEIVGNEPETYYSVSIVRDGYLFIKENVITDAFKPVFASENEMPYKLFPIIISRNALLNCKYIAYLSEHIFIIRYVHSYPDGNMTSFYHEEVYYFVR